MPRTRSAGTGFELVAYSSGGRVDEHVGWERRYLSRVMGTLVDGAVLVTPTVTDVQYDGPIVAVDPHTGPSRLPTVTRRQPAGRARGRGPPARASATRRIGMVTGRADLVSASCASRATARRSPRPASRSTRSCCGSVPSRPSSARDAARELLTLPEPPTAIFAANDLSALATLEVAAELGVDVPGELSVVGFDNIPESALARSAADHGRAAHPADGPRGHRPCSSRSSPARSPRTTHVTLETELVLRRPPRRPGPRERGHRRRGWRLARPVGAGRCPGRRPRRRG